MSIVFISDIHGCPTGLRALQERAFPILKPRQIVILGDVLYHGPRNGVMGDYDTQAVVDILNGMKEKITAVRGNCDADVDQMLLQFPIMSRYSTLLCGNVRFFLTHGHVWNAHNLPPLGAGDVLASGHTHIPELYRHDSGMIIFNPGSVSIPKNYRPPTFGLLDDDENLSVRYIESPLEPIDQICLHGKADEKV